MLLLPLWAFVVCYRVKFTFTFYISAIFTIYVYIYTLFRK